MSIIINAARTALSTWLQANGVNPKEWAPWVAMNHYLSRKGTDLDLSGNEMVVRLAALAIKRQIAYSESTCCDYNTSQIPMQTKTPYLGSHLDGLFNELTATIGGFSFIDEGEYYLIVDRYDWYDTGVEIDLPSVIRPLVDKAPNWLKSKLGIAGYRLNQGAMPLLGVSFSTIIKVPKTLVDKAEETWFYTDKVIQIGSPFAGNAKATEEDWDNVCVTPTVAEANRDGNWTDVGRLDQNMIILAKDGITKVVSDDIYGGYAVAAELCCLLGDKPQFDEYEDFDEDLGFEEDSDEEGCTETRSDGTYVVYSHGDFHTPESLPWRVTEMGLEVYFLRRAKRRDPEWYETVTAVGWHPAVSIDSK